MAMMIPDYIPAECKSAAEKRIFNKISMSSKSNHWIGLHSLTLAEHSKKRIGEIDFLLITEMGLFVLEIKGGRVARSQGVWTFTDKNNNEFRKSEGPFEQATSAMFSLEKKLKERFGESSKEATCGIGAGCVFPDIMFKSDRVDLPQEVIFDRNDMTSEFSNYVSRLANHWRSRDVHRNKSWRLDDETTKSILNYVRGDFDKVPALSVNIENSRFEQHELTRKQYHYLDMNRLEDRILMDGPAGTGKTMLAIEVALRENVDKQVLFILFNRNLAKYIDCRLNSLDNDRSNITVASIHDFIRKIIHHSSIKQEFEGEVRQCDDDRTVYQEIYPEFAEIALPETSYCSAFDLLIIDEAQDILSESYLGVFDSLLNGGMENGKWRMFLDSNNQANVYGQMSSSILKLIHSIGSRVLLVDNCRNTIEINDFTNALSAPDVTSFSTIPGEQVEVLRVGDTGNDVKVVTQQIEKLLEDGVHPSQITLLTPSAKGVEELLDAEPPDSCRLKKLEADSVQEFFEKKKRTIWVSTVSGFKGLESDIAILSHCNDIDNAWMDSILYVGLTRARSKLIVLMNNSLSRKYRENLRRDRY